MTRSLSIFLFLAIAIQSLFAGPGAELSALEHKLLDQGLVDIQSLDPSILVDLKYSSTDNFLNEDAYGDLETCYLQPLAAKKLSKAQAWLKEKYPHLTLLVYDGVRPRSIQRKMWALVVGKPTQDYVANPDRGSVHNYGFAVDLTVATQDGTPLDMGTAFDYFGDLAQPRFEDKFLKSGDLTPAQVANRKILREAMITAGFEMISVEWWHFNALPVKIARSNYQIVE